MTVSQFAGHSASDINRFFFSVFLTQTHCVYPRGLTNMLKAFSSFYNICKADFLNNLKPALFTSTFFFHSFYWLIATFLGLPYTWLLSPCAISLQLSPFPLEMVLFLHLVSPVRLGLAVLWLLGSSHLHYRPLQLAGMCITSSAWSCAYMCILKTVRAQDTNNSRTQPTLLHSTFTH